MNVNKINTLSGIHRTLSRFHKLCVHNDVELAAIKSTHLAAEVTLGSSITQSIIDKVRKAVLEEMAALEEEIKQEASNG